LLDVLLHVSHEFILDVATRSSQLEVKDEEEENTLDIDDEDVDQP